MALHSEKVTKQSERGTDPEICFAKMKEDRDMKNSIGGEVIEDQAIIMQQSAKEVGR